MLGGMTHLHVGCITSQEAAGVAELQRLFGFVAQEAQFCRPRCRVPGCRPAPRGHQAGSWATGNGILEARRARRALHSGLQLHLRHQAPALLAAARYMAAGQESAPSSPGSTDQRDGDAASW
jgi:hypothetical protein